MIKHFLRKNRKKIIVLLLMLTMWGAGFYCAWKIQERKIERYRVIIIKAGMLIDDWERKVEKIEKEKKKREEKEKKMEKWNRILEDQ